MNSFQVPDRQTILLERLRFVAQTRISRQVLVSAKVHEYEDIALRQLVLSLEASVLAEKLVDEEVSETIQMPASWWQHFKLTNCYLNLHRDWIMRYCAERWPVKFEARTLRARFTRYAVFPESTLRVPELGQPVIIERWDRLGGL